MFGLPYYEDHVPHSEYVYHNNLYFVYNSHCSQSKFLLYMIHIWERYSIEAYSSMDFSQFWPSKVNTFMPVTVPESRQWNDTPLPSGLDRGV